MMEKEKLDNLLNRLADMSTEPVRPELAEEIKNQIPSAIGAHRAGLDTIRIIVDLRVSRLAAAAVIIATMILCTSFFGGFEAASGDFYQESKLLVKYFLTGEKASSRMLANLPQSSTFFEDGREVVYYGEKAGTGDKDTLLMHWKLSENKYRIIYGDFRTEVVDAERLIKLQAEMLQKR